MKRGTIINNGIVYAAGFDVAYPMIKVLHAGETELVIESPSISAEGMYDPYIEEDYYLVVERPLIKTEEGKLTMTFSKAYDFDFAIGVRVVNNTAYYDANTKKLNELNSNLTVKQKVLTSGQTTVTYTDNSIDSNACFDWYADKEHQDLLPSDWSVSGNTLTVTYDAQSEDVTVGVEIKRGVVV